MTLKTEVTVDLLPCPFCGGAPTVKGKNWSGHGEGGTLYAAVCECGVSVASKGQGWPYHQEEAAGKAGAIAAWNRRAHLATPAANGPGEASTPQPGMVTVPRAGHAFTPKETDRHLLSAYTSTNYYGDYPDYFNLTMLRMDGSVVLTVRLPTVFGAPEGATATVRFKRELWREFVKAIPAANKVYEAADFLDCI